jgi:hypothetical protein
LDELFERPYGRKLFERFSRRVSQQTFPAKASHTQAGQTGCSARPQQAKDEAYVGWYVEKLSEARTQPTACFTSL